LIGVVRRDECYDRGPIKIVRDTDDDVDHRA
jgi:hypothetical protein